MEKRKWIRKFDIIIIAAIAACAIIFFSIYMYFAGSSGNVAEILVDGKVTDRISLNKDQIFSISQKENIKFEIKDGAIRFLESDCPDKVCVHTGFIKSTAQTAVCLPNAVSVRIISSKDDGIDTIVG